MWPVFHIMRFGTTYVQSDQHWNCFEDNLRETVEIGRSVCGPFTTLQCHLDRKLEMGRMICLVLRVVIDIEQCCPILILGSWYLDY